MGVSRRWKTNEKEAPLTACFAVTFRVRASCTVAREVRPSLRGQPQELSDGAAVLAKLVAFERALGVAREL